MKMNASRYLCLAVFPALMAGAPAVSADVCNIKVVTDANPDYSDIGSLIYSATSNWQTDKDKVWAMFYWNHIARRQTSPMQVHGTAHTDPIRQFNDFGYTMCSTISGINCGLFGAMGYNIRYWDISLHTVMDVEYDGKYHMIDNSLSALYTLCDGKTLAAVPDIGAEIACEASGGKAEPGHIAKYHCLYSTSPNGCLTGADTIRSVAEEYRCFNPNGLKYRHYFSDWELGHRYILNLREGEAYARYYRRMDADSSGKVKQTEKSDYSADPAYYVPNGSTGKDPEAANPRYAIRGNGIRTYRPLLKPADWMRSVYSSDNITAAEAGLRPLTAGQPGEAVFRVEGGNIICSMVINATIARKGADDAAAMTVSTDNGLHWREVYRSGKTGEERAEVKLQDEVNGSYDVLVKVSLTASANAADVTLGDISFKTITMLNSKTQPRLRLGKNTVYVGAGEPTQSIVIWPDLQADAYKSLIVDEKNVKAMKKHMGYQAVLRPDKPGEPAYVTYRIDAPGDLTRLTYGGRLFNRDPKGYVEFLYSLDAGTNWVSGYKFTDSSPPWDVIHFVKTDIPAGHRSVLVRYMMVAGHAEENGTMIGLYSARMEANYRPADATFKPMDVVFTWKERQQDYSTVTRRHAQRIEKVPFTYDINVGGADHPIVDSLEVGLAGAGGAVAYGYGDGKDNADAKKFTDRWVTCGKVLSVGKPYAVSVPSMSNWGAGDPEGKKLTDNVVGPNYAGGTAYGWGPLYDKTTRPEIVVDLGQSEKCGAFRIHVGGFPWWDGLKGQVKDKVEVLVSTDNKEFTSVGQFNFNLRWKDLAANFMWPDDEGLAAYNYELVAERPVDARYVKFLLTPARLMGVSEVQVLESITYEPFDLKIALPDGKDRGDLTSYLPQHTRSQPFKRK